MLPGEKNILLIGVGNVYRRDDGVGHFIVNQIKSRGYEHVAYLNLKAEGIDLIEHWKNFSTVILFDAVSCTEKPGTVFRFELPPDELPKNVFGCSTHAFNIADAIHLARALNQCPAKIVVFGIAGKDFETGQGLSQEVHSAALTVTDQVQQEIQHLVAQK